MKKTVKLLINPVFYLMYKFYNRIIIFKKCIRWYNIYIKKKSAISDKLILILIILSNYKDNIVKNRNKSLNIISKNDFCF